MTIKCALIALAILATAQELTDVEVSDRFAEHIERIEGFRAKAYRDTGGVLTIGYGHKVLPSETYLRTVVITREEGERLLRKDVKKAVEAVNDNVRVLLKQEQFDALVSFVFNVGETAFRRSTLLRKLNDNHCCAVPDEMRRWVRDDGWVVQGLVNRRNAEIAVYTGEG